MPTLSDIKPSAKTYRLPEKIETILIPTDFSDASRNAFLYALDLASRLGSDLVVAHIHSENEAEHSEDEFKRTYKRYKQAAKLRSIPDTLNISALIEEGEPAESILTLGQKIGADLIVMGTQGAASHDNKPLGSIAASVIEKTLCPVLAVPAEASYRPIEHLLYAMAFASSDQMVIDYLLELSEQLKAPLSCVHVSTDHSDWEDIELEEFRETYNSREDASISFQMVDNPDLLNGLQDIISQMRVDVLVMNTRNRSLFERFFAPSITRSMLLYADLPLLALHA
ncbi:MAG: universal stress protein [Bacteroidota bacterium]